MNCSEWTTTPLSCIYEVVGYDPSMHVIAVPSPLQYSAACWHALGEKLLTFHVPVETRNPRPRRVLRYYMHMLDFVQE